MRSLNVALLFIFLGTSQLFADEILFSNGDRLTGTILKVTDTNITLDSDLAGKIEVSREGIESINGEDREVYLSENFAPALELAPEPEFKIKWTKQVSLGYSQAGGNTEKSQFNGELKVDRKTEGDEFNLKWTGYYATSDKTTDVKKYYGLVRYAYSYGEDLKWYRFVKMEADQDKFSNVSWRVIPSAGIGYWFSDEDDYKAMVEGALGYEYTSYHDGTSSEGELIFVPRGFFEKVLVGDLRFREDVTLYPSLEEIGEFRIHSETALINPLTEMLDWKISFIDDYDSDPKGTAENNDYRLILNIVLF